MSISFIPNVISSGYNLSRINDNFNKIATAFEDALSRSGTVPNQMNSDLDMNGNNILNITGIGAESIIIDGITAEEFLYDSVDEIIAQSEAFALAAEASAVSAGNSATSALGYANAASVAAGEAEDLVTQATAGFIGFTDGLGYDFGSIATSTTYFDQDWGSIA
jgi:hypothetical protein